MPMPNPADLEEWATWFKCLADPTRLKILSYVSRQEEPVTVGMIVDYIGQSQSNVSRHLSILADREFILTEADGVRTLVRRNDLCLVELPEAAAAIMGRDQPTR